MRKLLIVLVGLGITSWCCILGKSIDTKYKEPEIDLISTVTMNNQEKLFVVANRDMIKNKLEFAKEILDKYLNNSFDSIKLSSDLNSDIETIDVEVYLNEEEIEQCHPEMEIKYRYEQNEKVDEKAKKIEISINGTIYKMELKEDE